MVDNGEREGRLLRSKKAEIECSTCSHTHRENSQTDSGQDYEGRWAKVARNAAKRLVPSAHFATALNNTGDNTIAPEFCQQLQP